MATIDTFLLTKIHGLKLATAYLSFGEADNDFLVIGGSLFYVIKTSLFPRHLSIFKILLTKLLRAEVSNDLFDMGLKLVTTSLRD